MKAAIIGLPQSGKTTLFQALAGSRSARERGALSIGTVKVPDPRVDRLAEMYRPERVIHASLEVVEAHAPGMGRDSRRQGLDAAFLNLVRPMDAFLLVVRAFDEEGLDEPVRDVLTVLSDLILSDLMTVENRLERLATERKKGKPVSSSEVQALELARQVLEAGRCVSEDANLRKGSDLQPLALLTARPILVIANIAERDLTGDPKAVLDRFGLPVQGLPTFACCARVEAEVGDLPAEERDAFRRALGVREPVMDQVTRGLYKAMGLISFLTVGEDEVRAWTIREGTLAPQAAGVVHSDMERGFIRAEVISFDDLVSLGSEAAARKAGRYRLEGRDYAVQDGDVIHFRFAT